mgnify:CR=1 FL=1
MEIELKFLLDPKYLHDFHRVMESGELSVYDQASLELKNIYYDTPDHQLRLFDIGFRTRASVSQGLSVCEQTVKLAGEDIGGLHRRPEYTVSLGDGSKDSFFADLTLFDASIWPASFEPNLLQSQLVKLFETDFQRHIWRVSLATGTRVECVLDVGEVKANGGSRPICEIELELIEGQVGDVFQLAHAIANKLPVKLGVQSKAARGYQLFEARGYESSNLEINRFEQSVSVEDALIAMLSKAIGFVQYNELALSAEPNPKPLRRIIDGLSMMIHVLQLFAPNLPNSRCIEFIQKLKEIRKSFAWVDVFYQLQQLQNRKSPYRKDIEKSEFLTKLLATQRLPDDQMALALSKFESHEFNQFILSLIEWLSLRKWRSEISLEQLSLLQQPVRTLADAWLSDAWHNLKGQLKRFGQRGEASSIEKLYWPLATELLTGLCVGSLYPEEEWQAFRNPLVDLLLGCEELMLLNTLDKLVAEQGQDADDLTAYQSWLQGKRQSLTIALSASISNTLKLKPYW